MNLDNTPYESLLERISDDRLREAVREKYEEDVKEFTAAAEDFKPSTEHSYWAKNSCHKCYGRGIIGTRHVFPPEVAAESAEEGKGYKNSFALSYYCPCGNKNYKKWLKGFREFYNALRDQNKGMNVE